MFIPAVEGQKRSLQPHKQSRGLSCSGGHHKEKKKRKKKKKKKKKKTVGSLATARSRELAAVE